MGSDAVTALDLLTELEAASAPELLERTGRTARTLIKTGPLRVILIVLGPGGALPEHRANGPITVQPLRGQLIVTADGREHRLIPGRLLALAAGLAHEVTSADGGAFLLTVAQAER